MLRATVIVCGILLGLLVAGIVIAVQHDLFASLQHFLADPWGVVTLLDLGIGLLFIAAWMAVVETRPLHATLWIVALFVMGNVVTLIFLLWRTRTATRFRDLFLPNRQTG